MCYYMMDFQEQSITSSIERRNNILATIQYFNTNAEDFTDFLFNIAIEDFVACIPVISKSMQEFFNCDTKLDNGMEKFVQSFYQKLERNSEILEKYLEEVVLHVPTQEYKKSLSANTTDDTVVETQGSSDQIKKITFLKEKLAKLNKEKHELRHEIKKNNDLKSKLKAFNEQLDQTLNSIQNSDILRLAQTVANVSSNISEIDNNK